MRPLRIFSLLILEEASSLWHRQLVTSLKRMGHEVVLPDGLPLRETWHRMGLGIWGAKDRNAHTDRILSSLKAAHRESPIDLFFVYQYPWQFNPELFQETTALGIPSLYFFCDNISEPHVAAQQGRKASLCWVPEVDALPQFKSAGARFLHLPMAASPEINYPVTVKEDWPCSFMGAKNPSRRRILGYAARQGIELKIFGSGWAANESYESLFLKDKLPEIQVTQGQKMQRWLRYKVQSLKDLLKHGVQPRIRTRRYAHLGEEFEVDLRPCAAKELLNEQAANEFFSRASITLGINEQFVARNSQELICYSKLRDFEATMAGACYLTQATPDLPALFEENKEIMVYRSAEELVEKARFLLQHPEVRLKMRAAVAKRARAEHDWVHRFQRAFKELGLRTS